MGTSAHRGLKVTTSMTSVLPLGAAITVRSWTQRRMLAMVDSSRNRRPGSTRAHAEVVVIERHKPEDPKPSPADRRSDREGVDGDPFSAAGHGHRHPRTHLTVDALRCHDPIPYRLRRSRGDAALFEGPRLFDLAGSSGDEDAERVTREISEHVERLILVVGTVQQLASAE